MIEKKNIRNQITEWILNFTSSVSLNFEAVDRRVFAIDRAVTAAASCKIRVLSRR